MNKIKRPLRPDIKIYTEKNFKLNAEQRTAFLKLIDKKSIKFKSFIPRLLDPAELFTKAEHETLLAIAYYSNPENFKDGKKITDKKAPTFSVYKDKELKAHLSKIFNKKCAYCDSEFLSVGNADIEHFRPKAAFNPFRNNKDESLIAPGYYWLAADWDNLLWSCVLCNRKNNLEESNSVGLKPLGKKNRFPISKENKRVRSHNDNLAKENKIRLILDPCVDDPTEHLVYLMEDGVLGIVQSKLNRQNKPSPAAEASISIYGLNRANLVIVRERTALLLKGIFNGMLRMMQVYVLTMEAVQAAKDAGQDASEKEAEALQIEKEFTEQKKLFNEQLSATSPYLAMKQFLLEDFKKIPLLKKLDLDVEGLIEN